jgi:hypothetical protein
MRSGGRGPRSVLMRGRYAVALKLYAVALKLYAVALKRSVVVFASR